jgi:hypothetical protein
MEIEQDLIRYYKDRFRILLILYFFSEENDDKNVPRVFYGEIKIQAIDFFLRNPDYLCLQLLSMAENSESDRAAIKSIVKKIYKDEEPDIRRVEMEKFFYGAYEDIDDIIAFLVSRGLIRYESKLRTNNTVAEKHYYLTAKSVASIENAKSTLSATKWYFSRFEIIMRYLGGSSGSELKAKQYQVEEYSTTPYRDKIQSIDEEVYEKYYELYGQNL